MKVLLYDVENTPNVSYTWPGRLHDVGVVGVQKEWELLSIAYKWLGQSKVYCLTRQGEDTDKELVKKFGAVLAEADVVVYHYGDKSDKVKINARREKHKLPPVVPPYSFDTYTVAKQFHLNSYSLGAVAEYLGVGHKERSQPFSMWLECMSNKQSAWNRMIAYNKKDVVLLERVFNRLKRWAHKNRAASHNRNKCVICKLGESK